MSDIARMIIESQDKDGMILRALETIIKLYADKAHFVYELLQNAEDAEATVVRFEQYEDRLEVLHNGKPFTSENLKRLCDIAKSDKIEDVNKIGKFGVGFKSVFGICEKVELYSAPQNFRRNDIGDAISFAIEINDFTHPVNILENELGMNYTTRFVFPFAVGRSFTAFESEEELNETLSSKLQNLGINTLLFMHNLEQIEYRINIGDNIIEGQYLVEKKDINDHCQLISAIGETTEKDINNESEIISYLKFSRLVGNDSNRTVDIAFSIVVKDDGSYEFKEPNDPFVSVYFPTETESKFGFIVQGPYKTTPNRGSIPSNDKDNKLFVDITSSLLRDSLLELRERGQLTMSLLKLLPLSPRQFGQSILFLPLYDTIKMLFATKEVIPTNNGGYVIARCAKIVRQEKLTQIIDDDLLSRLINDGHQYHWLPTFLTETNREYDNVYRFLTGDLKIGIIRPDDLRGLFANNPDFLPQMDEDWLVDLYSVLENVGNIFSKVKNETNMLTADIVKTSTGKFVAPYRKTENKQYVPNVFVPSQKIHSEDINFVDTNLYNRCRHFFDDILQIQKPNEYEYFIRDLRNRYSEEYVPDENKHIEDVRNLLRYLRYEEYQDEVKQIIKDVFVVKCTDNKFRNTSKFRVFLQINEDGINIEGYYKNIIKVLFLTDSEFYFNHGITQKDLVELGVRDNITIDETTISGTYETGLRGKQPEWYTRGDFKWKFSLDCIKDVLMYISSHPSAKDSIIKSQAILKTLYLNEPKLVGEVIITGYTQNLKDESCELIKILKGDKYRDWDGKWLYTDSNDLVSQKTVSKHDISVAYYGKIRPESIVYDLLGFRKTEADEVDDLRKTISKKQLDAFFEKELKQRFGISSAELHETFGKNGVFDRDSDDSDDVYPFPFGRVKSWDALRKHAAEMLLYADPVQYQYEVRRIRTSSHEKEAKAYLKSMYRYDGVYKFACQMCHESTANIERSQIFKNPEVELDPMNLCLCPNCAAMYRQIRDTQENSMDVFKKMIVETKESDVTNGEQVVIPLTNKEIWFNQTHFAEIQELIKLSEEVKSKSKDKKPDVIFDNEDEKSGLSVFAGYKGKTIKRSDGFEGIVQEVDDEWMYVHVTKGPDAGEDKQFSLSFVLKSTNLYTFE